MKEGPMAKKKKNKQIVSQETKKIEPPAPAPIPEPVITVEPIKEDVVTEVIVEAAPKVDFDVWFAMRGPRIPGHHHKEIIKADFKGRGLGQSESMEVFDEALRKYGIKLN